MDRPKHRRFILRRNRTPGWQAHCCCSDASGLRPQNPLHFPPRKPLLGKVRRSSIEQNPSSPTRRPNPAASTPAASPTQSATGLRGRIVDAVTRQPIREFTVRLERIEREGGGIIRQNEPIARKFASDTGRFAWDVAAGYWLGTVQAPGYQQFNLEEQEFSADKPTRERVMPLLRGLRITRARVRSQHRRRTPRCEDRFSQSQRRG